MTVLFFISSTRHTCRDRLEGICQYARTRDWHVQVVERAFHRVSVREVLDFWKPVGIIAECGSGAEELTAEAFGDLPVVYFDADPNLHRKGCFVGQDNAQVGRLAAARLLALNLPHYAFAGFRLPMFWNRERREAYVARLADSGHTCFVFDPSRAQQAMARQKDLSAWLAKLPRPCGIFAANDYVGEEVINACGNLGLSVPTDIAVLGVDNDESLCDNVAPTLSSIAPEFREGGRLAAELLGSLMDVRAKVGETRLFTSTRVVTRQSTRRLICDRGRVAAAIEYIRRCACVGIGVPDVAHFMGKPRRTAELHFREATGHSILEEIEEVRFARVFELLQNPRQSLTSIVDLAGFSTEVALRKAFRLRMGMSMRTWRKTSKICAKVSKSFDEK